MRQPIFQTWDATWANYVANKPEVFDTFALHLRPEPIDLSEITGLSDYKLLTNGIDAFMLADQVSPVAFHCHSIFDVTCRGRDAIREGRKLVQWMWDNTPALMLFGATPIENKAARWFNRQIGATSDGIHIFRGEASTFDAEWFHILRPGLPG